MKTSWLCRRQTSQLFISGFHLSGDSGVSSYSQGASPATARQRHRLPCRRNSGAGGTLLISWPAFTSADQKPVAAGTMSVIVGAGGTVNLNLVPNQGATPSGTYYKVVLKLDDGTTTTEYWTVPSSSPAKIAAMRSSVVPASVAAQMVSRQYLDSSLTTKANDAVVVHNSGDESVTGVKTFAASPLVPTPTASSAAVNKSYVDNAVSSVSTSSFVNKSGDSMTGPLNLVGDPTSSSQAANRTMSMRKPPM